MARFSTQLPPYAPELFVDRENEVALVTGIARQISEGAVRQVRTVVFHGERGIGKTWLSLHLKRVSLPDILGTIPLLISLFPPSEGYLAQKNEWFAKPLSPLEQTDPEAITREIVEWVAGRAQATTAPDASLRELIGWLARDVEQKFEHRVLALILDSVFEADWSLLELLETYLLAPLAALPRVLIVMTGRGRPYPWESPYLRVEVQDQRLEPFTPEKVRTQLRLQAPGTECWADEIMQLGGRHPMNNFLLAQASTPIEALDAVAEVLFSVLPSEEQRRRVRAYFEALCPLDGFREDEIRYMLTTYFEAPGYEAWPTPKVRQVRDELLATHLMRWEAGRFVVDEPVRLVLENFLKVQRPETWYRLQCRAYWLYHEWATRYARWNDYYNGRAVKHAAALRESGRDPDECPYGPASSADAVSTSNRAVQMGMLR